VNLLLQSLTPGHTKSTESGGGGGGDVVNNVTPEGLPNVVGPSVKPKVTDIMEDDEDEDLESLVKRVPTDTKTLEDCIISSQGCLLLLMLKQHLKDTYGITDSRISGYSPSDATKAYERPVNRRNIQPFEPKCTIANLNEPPSGLTPEGRSHIIEQYIHFKQLMLRIDPEEGDEDGEAKPVKLKIDQALFQYPKSRPGANEGAPSSASGSSSVEVSPVKASTNSTSTPGTPQYACIVQTPNSTPVAKVDPIVRVPKLTIVPLRFPGQSESKEHKKSHHHHKEHKMKDHNHHHKYKKSKHKKKKRYAVSDDDDSDNPDSDPDFRL